MVRLLLALVVLVVGVQPGTLAGQHGSVAGGRQDSELFWLSPSVIESIAKKHVRFAATLANQNERGFREGTYTIHWTPVPLAPGDIQAFLHKDEHKDYFVVYNEKAKEVSKQVESGSAKEILYRLVIERPDPKSADIRLTVVAGSAHDPPGERLVVRVRRIQPGVRFGATPENTDWSITPKVASLVR